MENITQRKEKEKLRKTRYYSKGWIMGNNRRIREYGDPVFCGYHSHGGRKVTDEVITSIENREIALNRMRDNIVCLARSNFNGGSKFITLTFAENVVDLSVANNEFKKFIKRLRYEEGNFKYLAVIEFQKRGAIHYHMISDLFYISNHKLRRIWSGGFVRINRIKHVDDVGAYLVKYMCKADDLRLHKRKAYLRSGNLEKPRVLIGAELRQYVEDHNLKDRIPARIKIYHSKHHGWVTEREYILKQTAAGKKAREKQIIKKCERIAGKISNN